MSWKNLKYFALAVLLIMNVYFGTNVYLQSRSVNYYSDEEIETATALLSASKLYFSRRLLEVKKVSMPVCESEFNREQYKKVISSMLGKSDMSEENGAINVVTDDGQWSFCADYAFEYSTPDSVSPKTALLEEGVTELITTEEYERFYNKAAGDFISVKRINASSPNRGANKTDARLYRLFYNGSRGIYIAMFLQYIGGIQTKDGFYLTFDGDKVISGEGCFALILPKTEKTTSGVDLIDLLLREKRALDAQYGDKDRTALMVSSVVYTYDVYSDAGGTRYYVPVCNLIYTDGTTHGYNLVDGKKE